MSIRREGTPYGNASVKMRGQGPLQWWYEPFSAALGVMTPLFSDGRRNKKLVALREFGGKFMVVGRNLGQNYGCKTDW